GGSSPARDRGSLRGLRFFLRGAFSGPACFGLGFRARFCFRLLPPRPLHLERLALGDREVAVARPAAGERQPVHAAAVAAEQREQAHGALRRPAIEPWTAREKRPDAEARARGRRRQMPLEFALAPV